MTIHGLVRPRTPMEKIAARIHEHLARFEADPEVNYFTGGTRRRFYQAGAGTRGRFVSVTYISYQGSNTLTKKEAEAYLAWLDAGNVGRHFEQQREEGTK